MTHNGTALIPATTLESIMRLTGVREEYQAAASARIEAAAVIFSERRNKRQHRKRRPTALLKKMAALSDDLCSAIDQLDEELETDIALWFFNSAASWGVDDDEDELHLYDMKDRLEALSESCRQLAHPRLKKPAHRPQQSFKDPALRGMIYWLQEAIERTGEGKLSLSQDANYEAQGRLPEVLNALRQHIPNVVPTKLPPYPTLVRIMRDARRRYDRPPPPLSRQ
jgi:hypothetical protein